MSDQSGGRPPSSGSSSAASAQSSEEQTSIALARACARVLLDGGSDTAVRMRAELRKEAVGLDMKSGPEAKAAAAAIRRLLDGS